MHIPLLGLEKSWYTPKQTDPDGHIFTANSWIDLIPAYVACISLASLLSRVVVRKFSHGTPTTQADSSGYDSSLARPKAASGRANIDNIKVLRLCSTIALVAISAVSIFCGVGLAGGQDDWLRRLGWAKILSCITYIYTLLLSIVAMMTGQRSRDTASTSLTIILVVAFFVSAYHALWPLMLAQHSLVPSPGVLQWGEIVILFFSAVLLPLLSPRQYTPLDPKESAPDPNPEQTASIFSLLTYHFLDPIIWKAYLDPKISYDELPPLADYDNAKHLLKRATPLIHSLTRDGRRHIFWSLMRVFQYEYVEMTSMLVLTACFMILNPLAIKQLLSSLENNGEDPGIQPWVWIAMLFLAPTCASLTLERYIFVGTGTLVRMESILTQLIYEHTLRIRVQADSSHSLETSSERSSDGNSKDSIQARNIQGRINNLVTTDMATIAPGRDFLTVVLWTPVLVALSVWFLYEALGWSAFVGVAVMFVLVPLPGNVAKMLQSTQREAMKKTDARVQTITETLNVLRMIKLFGWEAKMNGRISEKRDDELRWVRKGRLLSLLSRSLNYVIPAVTMIVVYTTYTVIMKQELTAATVFSSLAAFDILREQLNEVFWMAPRLIAAKVSLDRINEFLHETDLLASTPDVTTGSSIEDYNKENTGFNEASFCWRSDKSTDGVSTPKTGRFTLRIENELVFKRGGINLVTGPTGSGKTSLLMALLGEMRFIRSAPSSWYNLPRGGGIAYAAQESWVQNLTIEENILFGSPYEEVRYKQVIQQCALEHDLKLFDAGDMTEVGEKGLTLSGGQKARLTLARAVYSNAEILLLDDVFAALDVHTARWIIDKCFRGPLIRGRTVLLVTHNVDLVKPIASFVVTVHSDGTVSSYESVSEALKKGEDIGEAAAYTDEHNDKDTKPNSGPLEQASAKPKDGKLVETEEVAVGHVSWAALKLYFNSLGGQWNISFWNVYISTMLAMHLSVMAETWSLGYWSQQYETHPSSEVNVTYYLSIYIMTVLVTLVFILTTNVLWVFASLRGSKSIHRRLVDSVMGATYRWLDVTPISRVITRCTADIQAIDRALPDTFFILLTLTLSLATKLGIVVFLTPVFIFPGLLVFVIGGMCGRLYIASQLAVKRQQSVAKAPILAHFGGTLAGLVSVRAYGAETAFTKELQRYSDRHTRVARTYYILNRWISFRIQVLGAIFSAGIAAYLMYHHKRGETQASDTGFSMNMAAGFSALILWWVRSLNDFEVQGNSVERISQYVAIEQEPKPTNDNAPPAHWPSSGDLRVENMSARYSVDGPAVLRDISFHIKSGERIGIVGRTGSGKSSLTLSLLRCILTEGDMYYDGLHTTSINLDTLRSSITIIPQVPELLRGTLRENLDPFGEHDDATLNSALRASGLFSLQAEAEEGDGRLTLETQISGAGANLSIGQRQILALARALVRGSKLFILDEATSSIDYKTDAVIQKSLRTELPEDVTVLIVAHRLQTIMDADRIMVLDAGRIAEFDTPYALLREKDSKFRAMVEGSEDSATLHSIAEGKL